MAFAGQFEHGPLLGNFSHVVRYFLKVGREKIVLKKKEKEPTDSMRSRDYDLHITLDQLYQFINEPLLGVFSIFDI